MNKALKLDLPNLALDLRRGLITLYVRKFGKFWSPHAMAEIDNENIDRRLNQLKSRANAGTRPQVELWLPSSEIFETTMPYKPLTYDSAAKYVADEFDIDPNNLIIAVEKTENQFGILAMSRSAARASYEYFAGHGFQPISLSTSAKLAFFDAAPRIFFADIFQDIRFQADSELDVANSALFSSALSQPETIEDETESAATTLTPPKQTAPKSETSNKSDEMRVVENEPSDENVHETNFVEPQYKHDEDAHTTIETIRDPKAKQGESTKLFGETGDIKQSAPDAIDEQSTEAIEQNTPPEHQNTSEFAQRLFNNKGTVYDYFASPKTLATNPMHMYGFLDNSAENMTEGVAGAVATQYAPMPTPEIVDETARNVDEFIVDTETLAHEEFDAIEATENAGIGEIDAPEVSFVESSVESPEESIVAMRDDVEDANVQSLTVLLTPEEEEAANAAAFGVADNANSLDTPSRYDALFIDTASDQSPIEAFYQEEKPTQQIETPENIYLISDGDDEKLAAPVVAADNSSKKRMAMLGFGALAVGAAATYFGFSSGNNGETDIVEPEIAVLGTPSPTEEAQLGETENEISLSLAPEASLPVGESDEFSEDRDAIEPDVDTPTQVADADIALDEGEIAATDEADVTPLDGLSADNADSMGNAGDVVGENGLEAGEDVVAVLDPEGVEGVAEIKSLAEISEPLRRNAGNLVQDNGENAAALDNVESKDDASNEEPQVVAVNEKDDTLATKLLGILNGNNETPTDSDAELAPNTETTNSAQAEDTTLDADARNEADDASLEAPTSSETAQDADVNPDALRENADDTEVEEEPATNPTTTNGNTEGNLDERSGQLANATETQTGDVNKGEDEAPKVDETTKLAATENNESDAPSKESNVEQISVSETTDDVAAAMNEDAAKLADMAPTTNSDLTSDSNLSSETATSASESAAENVDNSTNANEASKSEAENSNTTDTETQIASADEVQSNADNDIVSEQDQEVTPNADGEGSPNEAAKAAPSEQDENSTQSTEDRALQIASNASDEKAATDGSAEKVNELLSSYPLDINANDVTISASALSPKARAALDVSLPVDEFPSALAPTQANTPQSRPVDIATLAETAIEDAKRREREAARLAEERRQAQIREEEARKAAAAEKARQQAASKPAAKPAPAPKPKPAPAPKPLPKASSSSISLAGIEAAGANKYAIIRTPNGTQRVRVGQIIGGWQVTFIGTNNVILQRDGKTVQLVGK